MRVTYLKASVDKGDKEEAMDHGEECEAEVESDAHAGSLLEGGIEHDALASHRLWLQLQPVQPKHQEAVSVIHRRSSLDWLARFFC